MKLGDYSVEIPEGTDLGNGYVALKHGQVYTIKLANHSARRCDAIIDIDGLRVGKFRLDANEFWAIERPAQDTGHFTFFATGTSEARASGIEAGQETGLIRVEFCPEEDLSKLYSEIKASRIIGHSAGGTGLTGESDQGFKKAIPITYAFENEFVIINMRLVCQRNDSSPRPLPGRKLSSPVPPPIA